MKMRLDNQYITKTRNKNIQGEADKQEHLNLAILYKRIAINVAGKLVAHMQPLEARDPEIKRMLKLVSGMPQDSEQKVTFLITKIKGMGSAPANPYQGGFNKTMPAQS